jgi:hypothetical protein
VSKRLNAYAGGLPLSLLLEYADDVEAEREAEEAEWERLKNK